MAVYTTGSILFQRRKRRIDATLLTHETVGIEKNGEMRCRDDDEMDVFLFTSARSLCVRHVFILCKEETTDLFLIKPYN